MPSLTLCALASIEIFLSAAQLDMSKSPGFLAIEELLKAQDTHMKLKRQFQEEQIKEAIRKRREVRKFNTMSTWSATK